MLAQTIKTEKLLKTAYLGSVLSSNGDFSQQIKRKLRLRRAAMEELEKITKKKKYIIRDQGRDHPYPDIPCYYVWM